VHCLTTRTRGQARATARATGRVQLQRRAVCAQKRFVGSPSAAPLGDDYRKSTVTLPLICVLKKCRPKETAKVACMLDERGFHSVRSEKIGLCCPRFTFLG